VDVICDRVKHVSAAIELRAAISLLAMCTKKLSSPPKVLRCACQGGIPYR